MNILVVHETEYIKKVVFEYQVIPELWASRGHNVFVIDFETGWKRKNIFDLYSKTHQLSNVRKSGKTRGVTLVRPGFIKLPFLDRLSAMISHYLAIKKLIKGKKIDVIFLYSAPTNGCQTVVLAKKYKVPVYFRLLDVLHQLVPSKFLMKPTYLLEKYVYLRIDQLTAITPKLAEYAIRMGAKPETTSYLPSASDDDLFFPASKDEKLMQDLSLSKADKIITFAGTLYNFSGLDKVLDYFGKNLQKYPGIKFLIVGHGEQEEALKHLVEKYDIRSRVILTGFIEYEKLNAYLNLSDICINPFEINKVTDIIFPGKIYQYLACGKPVIATRLSGLIDIFPDINSDNVYYYDEKNVCEFFSLVKKIQSKQFKKSKNVPQSLREISSLIESDLKKLISASN